TGRLELDGAADEIYMRALVAEAIGGHDLEDLVGKRRRDLVAEQSARTRNDLGACGIDVLEPEILGPKTVQRILGRGLIRIPAVDRPDDDHMRISDVEMGRFCDSEGR